MPSEKPSRFERQKPTGEQREIIEYFTRFGLRLRNQLKILQDPRLKVGGNEAKKEGWFINYHSVLESALALKIAELLQLKPEERKILLEAAMTHHAYKRIQHTMKDSWGQEAYTKGQEEGNRVLRELGVSEDTITVNEITNTPYFYGIADGSINIASDEPVRILQRILALTHNSIDTRVSRSDDLPSQSSDIIYWKEHLDEVRQRNIGIASEVLKKVTTMSRKTSRQPLKPK